MAANDFPFAADIKFLTPVGSEVMFHVRAANVADFLTRLRDAAKVFPTAGIVEALGTPDAPIPDDIPTNVTPINAEAPGSPTQKAHERAATAAVARKNGTPTCDTHKRLMSQSKWGGWYCPAKTDGAYCAERIPA